MARSGWFLLTTAAVLMAQQLPSGPQVVTFFSEADDTDQPYGLYLPPGFDPTHKYPLVISLHGAYSNHRLNLRRVFGKGNLPGETDAEASRYFPKFRDVPYIVATPFARGTMGYQGLGEKDVLDVLADVRKRFSIDEDRVYLTGLSMGGGGALWMGLTRPDLWAAIAAVCPAAPSDAMPLAPNALNLPVHLFQGAIDPIVNPELTRAWASRLEHLGTKVVYTEYPAVRHNSWDSGYKDGAIFDWFAQFKRNRFPDRVRFVTDRYRYNGAYWVRLDEIGRGMASIDAVFTGPNQLVITTANLGGFTLSLAGHPKYSARRPVSLTIDGKPVRAGKSFAFSKKNGAWSNAAAVLAPGLKRAGAEGPLLDAFSSRHYYVYGTADNPSEEVIARRKAVAAKAAEWVAAPPGLMVSFKVMADRDAQFTEAESPDLILFGTRETNLLIRKYEADLPIALNAGAADYSLTYIHPQGNRYIVVNSGLPWWTGAENLRPVPLQFWPSPISVLAGRGDFLFFRGSVEDVIASGDFDASWKLPVAAAQKLVATGAVTIK